MDPETEAGTTDPTGGATSGQAAPSAGHVSDTAPAAAATGSTGETGAPTTPEGGPAPEDTFFDPKELDPALEPAYKSMQASYTRKMQALSEKAAQARNWEALQSDPAALQRIASQHGYRLLPPDAQPPEMQGQDDSEWEPENWSEVIARTKEETRAEVMRELAPIVEHVQSQHRSQIEQRLDAEIPEWREHEETMIANLARYPQMANDIDTLVKISIPGDVWERKAMAAATRKLQSKVSASGASRPSSTHQATARPAASSFEEAVAQAKQDLARRAG